MLEGRGERETLTQSCRSPQPFGIESRFGFSVAFYFFCCFFFSSFSSRSVGEVCAAGIVCSRFILCRKSWPVSQQSVWTNAVSLKRWILLGDTWREPRHVLLVSSSSDRTRGGKKKRTVEKKNTLTPGGMFVSWVGQQITLATSAAFFLFLSLFSESALALL